MKQKPSGVEQINLGQSRFNKHKAEKMTNLDYASETKQAKQTAKNNLLTPRKYQTRDDIFINIDSSAKNRKADRSNRNAVYSDRGIERGAGYVRESSHEFYQNDHAASKFNSSIQVTRLNTDKEFMMDKQRLINHTTDPDEGTTALLEQKKLKSFVIHKRLIFQNGVLVPSTKSQRDAMKMGLIQSRHQQQQQQHSDISSKNIENMNLTKENQNRNPNDALELQTRIPYSPRKKETTKTPKQQTSSGFMLQNKLVAKQREKSLDSYQQLLYRLSQPVGQDLLTQQEIFLKEDLFSSPKYRGPHQNETETMKIRFDDGSKVMSRSICGAKSTYTAIQIDRQKVIDKAEKERKLRAKYKARNKATQGSKMSRQSSNIFSGMKKSSSNASIQSLITFAGMNLNEFNGSPGHEQVIEKNISQEGSLQQSDIHKSDLCLLDMGKLTKRQVKARQNHSVYQKTWDRMNGIVSRDGSRRKKNATLINQQGNYLSPRIDCLTNFYESTRKSLNQCSKRRQSTVIEKAFNQEKQKFNNERCRQEFYGGLRNDNTCFVQTTRNLRNALFARVSTSSNIDPAYTAFQSMNLTKSQYQRDGLLDADELMVNTDMSRNGKADKLAKTHQKLEKYQVSRGSDTVNFQDQSIEISINPPQRRAARKKTTQIFDGAMISYAAEQVKKQQTRTYRAKSYTADRQGRRKTVHLPQVELAVKMHNQYKEVIEKQRALDAELEQMQNLGEIDENDI